jgi:hypothetical protein
LVQLLVLLNSVEYDWYLGYTDAEEA